MLQLENIDIFYGHVHAVRRASLVVDSGEIVTLIGANGAGKSSVLKAISGVHRVSRGRILFEGRCIESIPPHRIVSSGISHCPEGRRIFYDLTVEENLLMGGYVLEREEAAERMCWVLELFPVLKQRLRQLGGTLSGGEQQMLAIGRSLMNGPRLLLLDEPSLGLAPKLVEKIFETVLELNKCGLTLLLVEQNANYALEISHRAYVLEVGEIVLDGPSKHLRNDERVRKAYLGG